jgi:hypothetical protein
MHFDRELLLGDSAHGAVASAGAAGDAGISVDDVLGIALGNSANRAALCTGAAGNASVRNNICHGKLPPCSDERIVARPNEKINRKSEKS